MKIFHERFENRKNRIGAYLVIIATVIGYLPLFNILIPEWILIAAAVSFCAGIGLFIWAERESKSEGNENE